MIAKASKFCASLALVAGLSAVVVGCTNKANPDNVDRRAVERWNFLIERKAEKAYDYLTPGVRATQSREAYAGAMNTRPLRWKSVKFNNKECEAERCKVLVEVAYSATLGGGTQAESSSTQAETWILVDGEWFFLPSR